MSGVTQDHLRRDSECRGNLTGLCFTTTTPTTPWKKGLIGAKGEQGEYLRGV